MKILLCLLLAFNPILVFADCDFKTGIEKQETGYLYTTDCHKRVGKMVKDLEDSETEIKALRKNIELKDLALVKSDKQVMLWREETYEQHERLLKIHNASDREKWIWFALGVVVMGGATYAAGQLR